jgi:hypothetical protein
LRFAQTVAMAASRPQARGQSDSNLEFIKLQLVQVAPHLTVVTLP